MIDVQWNAGFRLFARRAKPGSLGRNDNRGYGNVVEQLSHMESSNACSAGTEGRLSLRPEWH